MKNTLKSIEQITASYDVDMSHPRQVARLAVELFDSCRELHGLSDVDRELLLYAGLLHDIGWHFGQQRHHKNSYDMILKDPPQGLSPREVKIVANVARYHRKGLPKTSHEGFAALKLSDREIVRRLASLLRIADGLDVTHEDASTVLACDVSEDSVRIKVAAKGDVSFEFEAAMKKSDLFVETFGKKVVFEAVNK